jgi:hypothetical protein
VAICHGIKQKEATIVFFMINKEAIETTGE